jgi:glutamate-ammonia-ligase adenylyltransferase
LYHIDLRLRPSGSAGPLLLSVDDLKSYLNQKAEAWERQAYLCHRFLPSSEAAALFTPRPLSTENKQQLRDIQNKLLFDTPASLDLKKNHGGLLHTELTLQLAALDAGVFPATPNVQGLCRVLQAHHSRELCSQIENNYAKLRSHQQLLILISQSAKPRIEVDSHEIDKISSVLQTSPKVLLQTLTDLLFEQKSLLNKLDPLRAQLKIEE